MTNPNQDWEKATVDFISEYITFGFLEGEHETSDGLIISPLYFDSHLELEQFYSALKSFISSLLTSSLAKQREEIEANLERAFRVYAQGNWNENSEIQALPPENDPYLVWGGIFGEEIGKEYAKFKAIYSSLSKREETKEDTEG